MGVPHSVIADNAGGLLMQRGDVDLVIVGTDRVTANGDVCNKIGTYLKALAAQAHGVPFYVALPSSTYDPATPDGGARRDRGALARRVAFPDRPGRAWHIAPHRRHGLAGAQSGFRRDARRFGHGLCHGGGRDRGMQPASPERSTAKQRRRRSGAASTRAVRSFTTPSVGVDSVRPSYGFLINRHWLSVHRQDVREHRFQTHQSV